MQESIVGKFLESLGLVLAAAKVRTAGEVSRGPLGVPKYPRWPLINAFAFASSLAGIN